MDRIYGYEKILPQPLGEVPDVSINTEDYAMTLVRNSLVLQGFSEIYTYTFKDAGVVELENPIAGDKNFLRRDLVTGLEEAFGSQL